ncbi:hypothetical protein D3C76_1644980 [compost metagenome]
MYDIFQSTFNSSTPTPRLSHQPSFPYNSCKTEGHKLTTITLTPEPKDNLPKSILVAGLAMKAIGNKY